MAGDKPPQDPKPDDIPPNDSEEDDDASTQNSEEKPEENKEQIVPTQIINHAVSTMKIPPLTKGDYDLWAMKFETHLQHKDPGAWGVIKKGNGPINYIKLDDGTFEEAPAKTVAEQQRRDKERRARTSLLMAIPEDHMAYFHKIDDAKDMWAAIKARFGGNTQSRKMRRYSLKEEFEKFSIPSSEALSSAYDRFQKLLSQMERYNAAASKEDANNRFLRALPSNWSQVVLIMKHKPDIEFWTFDDLYNHLKLYESDVAPASSPNVAFVSFESTSGTSYYSADSVPVNTDYYVSFPSSSETAAAYQEKSESSKKSDKCDKSKSDRSYQDRIIHSFFASNQAFPDLD